MAAMEKLCTLKIVGTYFCMLSTSGSTSFFRIAVIHDFIPDRRFVLGERYSLRYREPSSPRTPTGISLDCDGVCYGWIKEEYRTLVDQYLEAGKFVWCEVTKLENGFIRTDHRLGVIREWRFTTAICYVEELTTWMPDSFQSSSSLG
jgi:hypothetical protein